MRAVVFDGTLQLEKNYPDPVLRDGEALIKVSLAGICNTDIEITRGYKGFNGILGHEFVGTVLAEMTAGDSGIGYLMQTAGSQQRLPLAFAGLVVIGVMAMIMYELFSWIEKRTTGWAHRGSQAI